MKKDLLSADQKANKSDATHDGKQQPDYDTSRPKGFFRFIQIKYWQKHFNVTTAEVMKRCMKAMLPWDKKPIFEGGRPDLYGPMWIFIWNIIAITICGHFSSVLEFYLVETHKSGEEHNAELNKVSKIFGLLFFYILIIPTLIHFLFVFVGSGNPGFQRILAVYGYSFMIFIPASAILIVPISIAKYAILAVAGFTSLYHISKELIEAGTKFLSESVLKVVAIIWAVLHIGFWVLLRFTYFD